MASGMPFKRVHLRKLIFQSSEALSELSNTLHFRTKTLENGRKMRLKVLKNIVYVYEFDSQRFTVVLAMIEIFEIFSVREKVTAFLEF